MDKAVVTRAQAVQLARLYASLMHEDNPVLIDAQLTTQAEVRRIMAGPDGTTEGPDPRSTGMSDQAAEWLVRIMRGSFRPPHREPGPGPEPTARIKGWMWVIINAANGQHVGYGYVPEGYPLRSLATAPVTRP